MVSVRDAAVSFKQLNLERSKAQQAQFGDFWRTPFSQYSHKLQRRFTESRVIKAAKALKELILDIRAGPVGLIERKISKCIYLTKGAKHMHIAYLLSLLGCHLCSIDYQAEAETVHRRALCMAIKLLGQDHSQLAPAIDWLAYTLLRQGNHKECILLCYSSMSLTVRHVGLWHPNTANCYSNLATVLQTMGLQGHAKNMKCTGKTIFSCSGASRPVYVGQEKIRSVQGHARSHGESVDSSCNSRRSRASSESNVNRIVKELLGELEKREMENSSEGSDKQHDNVRIQQHQECFEHVGQNETSTNKLMGSSSLNDNYNGETGVLPSVLGDCVHSTHGRNQHLRHGYNNEKNQERSGMEVHLQQVGFEGVLPVRSKSLRAAPVSTNAGVNLVGINARVGPTKDQRVGGSNGSVGSEEDFKIGVGRTELLSGTTIARG